MVQNRRIELDAMLRTMLGSTNVYYDPPEGFKLKYPCIVYNLSGNTDTHAEDNYYRRMKRYTLRYITRNADDPMVDTIENLRYCSLIQPYTADGLFHYAYQIYF